MGKFVDWKGFRIWVWNTDVDGVLRNGHDTSYQQEAQAKFDSGFLNLMKQAA